MRGIARKLETQRTRFIALGDNLYSELTGKKTVFKFRTKISGKTYWIGIGNTNDITFPAAKEWARNISVAVSLKYDPTSIRNAIKRADIPSDLLVVLADQPTSQKDRVRGDTFEAVHKAWLSKPGKTLSPKTHRQYTNVGRDHLYPHFADRSFADLGTKDYGPVLTNIAINMPPTLKKVRQVLNGMYDFALHKGLVEANPIKALTKFDVPAVKHIQKPRPFVQVSDIPRVFQLATAAHDLAADMAHIAFMTGKRAGNIVEMAWEDIDLNAKLWTTDYGDTKNDKKHSVALIDSTVEVLLRQGSALKRQGRVFPAPEKSEGRHHTNIILERLKTVSGGAQTTHGLRHALKTFCSQAGYREDVRAVQLEHVKEGMSRVYDHADFLPQRRLMMEHWYDYLTGKTDLSEKARA